VLALTRTLAIEFGRKGVRSNVVCPGSIDTPITKAFHFPEGADQSLLSRILPFDGMKPPEDVASAVAFLLSDDARHINGEDLRIDGGTLS
jgi:NAD(P)-dependent dehydrogenase (short-subunit alcohol dehydrogenase family)